MKPKCLVCKAPLKHLSTNKWMCDQNSTICSNSLKIIFISLEEE